MYFLNLDVIGGPDLVLHGSGRDAVVEGAQAGGTRPLSPGVVEEVYTIALKGAAIQAWTSELEERLALARAGLRIVHLELQTESRYAPVRARVLDGWIEVLGKGYDDRARGYQGIRLHVVRVDGWDGVRSALNLSNRNGTDVWNGLTLYNHTDSGTGHDNFVDIKPGDLAGAQAGATHIQLNLGASPTRTIKNVVIAAGTGLKSETSAFDHVLEGESAAAGSGATASGNTALGTCSNGSYKYVEWTSASEVQVLKWTLYPSRLGWMLGRGFKPVVRLASLPAANIFLRWKIAAKTLSTTIDQTAQLKVNSTRSLVTLPTLYLPPQPLSPGLEGAGLYDDTQIELWAECVTAGTKRLELDFVQLLPVEQYAFLTDVGGAEQGNSLHLNGGLEQVYTENNTNGRQSIGHVLNGGYIKLRPGKYNRVYVLYETDSGFPVDDSLTLKIFYGPRWKTP